MIQVVVGDLATQAVSAVIRPIGSDGAPVSALSRDVATASGPTVEERLAGLGAIPLGGAVLTPGGDLPADFVIHVVVMSAEEPQSSAIVQKALRNGLRRAADWGLESLALPPLGLGAGAIQVEDAARALVQILFNHVDEGQAPLALTLVVTSEYEEELFARLIDEAVSERDLN